MGFRFLMVLYPTIKDPRNVSRISVDFVCSHRRIHGLQLSLIGFLWKNPLVDGLVQMMVDFLSKIDWLVYSI